MIQSVQSSILYNNVNIKDYYTGRIYCQYTGSPTDYINCIKFNFPEVPNPERFLTYNGTCIRVVYDYVPCGYCCVVPLKPDFYCDYRIYDPQCV